MTSIQRFAEITQAVDLEATRILGQAFDMACALLGHTPQPTAVREAMAKSIIETAKARERDPVRLREAGLCCGGGSADAPLKTGSFLPVS
jgi:hypothetical protein